MRMDPILRTFDHLEGLSRPGTCLIGVVPKFVYWLTCGDQHRGAGQDLSGA
jgi:hypothetical protein